MLMHIYDLILYLNIQYLSKSDILDSEQGSVCVHFMRYNYWIKHFINRL